VEPYEAACSTPLRTGDIQPKAIARGGLGKVPRSDSLQDTVEGCQINKPKEKQLV